MRWTVKYNNRTGLYEPKVTRIGDLSHGEAENVAKDLNRLVDEKIINPRVRHEFTFPEPVQQKEVLGL